MKKAKVKPEPLAEEMLATRRREVFCREYMIDLNGKKAAIRAGFSERTATSQASRLLADVNVLARIRELQEERSAKLSISSDMVLRNLLLIYDRCMQAVPVYEWVDGEKRPTGEFVFDSKGAVAAMQLIGKHLAMFTEKIELTTTDGIGDRLRAAFQKIEAERKQRPVLDLHPNRRVAAQLPMPAPNKTQ